VELYDEVQALWSAHAPQQAPGVQRVGDS